jgi:hypothetical protein
MRPASFASLICERAPERGVNALDTGTIGARIDFSLRMEPDVHDVVQFLRDIAARTMQLSRRTLDLATSRELRIMSDELKAKSREVERDRRQGD